MRTLDDIKAEVAMAKASGGMGYCFGDFEIVDALLDCAAALSAAKSELCIANCPARTHVDECTDAFNALTKLKEAGVTI